VLDFSKYRVCFPFSCRGKGARHGGVEGNAKGLKDPRISPSLVVEGLSTTLGQVTVRFSLRSAFLGMVSGNKRHGSHWPHRGGMGGAEERGEVLGDCDEPFFHRKTLQPLPST